MGITANLDIGRVTPAQIVQFVESQMTRIAPDCIFLSAPTGAPSRRFRRCGKAGHSIVSSNQAAIDVIWQFEASLSSKRSARRHHISEPACLPFREAADDVAASTRRKLHLRLLPLLFLLYIVAYLDRINIVLPR